MIKPQLYALIKEHKPRCTKMVIDELAREQGHHVLRLPPYHCKLNPIELIWGQAKGDVAENIYWNKPFSESHLKGGQLLSNM